MILMIKRWADLGFHTNRLPMVVCAPRHRATGYVNMNDDEWRCVFVHCVRHGVQTRGKFTS